MSKPDQTRKAGRPRTLPVGSKRQAYRGTDEEHAALMAQLKKMRAKPRKR